MDKETKQLLRDRAKWELKIKLLKVIGDFKSEEETTIELDEKDVLNVLSSIIVRRIE